MKRRVHIVKQLCCLLSDGRHFSRVCALLFGGVFFSNFTSIYLLLVAVVFIWYIKLQLFAKILQWTIKTLSRAKRIILLENHFFFFCDFRVLTGGGFIVTITMYWKHCAHKNIFQQNPLLRICWFFFLQYLSYPHHTALLGRLQFFGFFLNIIFSNVSTKTIYIIL